MICWFDELAGLTELVDAVELYDWGLFELDERDLLEFVSLAEVEVAEFSFLEDLSPKNVVSLEKKLILEYIVSSIKLESL